MNLFDAITNYDSLMKQIEESDGEITPELEEQLVIAQDQLHDKIKGYYYVIKGKEAEIDLAKDEISRLRENIQVKENLITRLKQVINMALEAFGNLTDKGTKRLDLGTLKVWQKKTIAMNLEPGLDDSRFCQKRVSFTLSYKDAENLISIISNPVIIDFAPIPSVEIVVIKDKLKQWLIDNEEEHRLLRDKVKEISIIPVTENIEDIKVLTYADIKHNTTVIFK